MSRLPWRSTERLWHLLAYLRQRHGRHAFPLHNYRLLRVLVRAELSRRGALAP